MNAETMAYLAGKGLSAAELVEVAMLMEAAAPLSSAAARQRRYRDRKRNERDVTRDVTPPPKEDIKPPSVSDETVVADDPAKQMFDMGVKMLIAQGHDERQARSIIGRWRKGRSPGDVVAGLIDAKTRSVSNLVEWMPKRLSATGPPDFLDNYLNERRISSGG